MANSPTDEQINKTNAQSTQAQAVLQSAQNRLSTTQDTFLKTQDVYQKSATLLIQQQSKMADIQANLTKLSKSKMGLLEVMSVLEACIKLVINVKKNIMDLCLFFQSMSATIEAIVEFSVKSFLDQIQAETAGGTGPGKIGPYSFTDLQRSLLFQAAVMLRGQFSVFGDIAAMWVKLSTEHIVPGLKMLDDLSVSEVDESKRQSLMADLQTCATDAIDGVQKIASTTEKEIQDGMQDRVNELQSQTAQLPPSPSMKKAITDGTDATHDASVTATKFNNDLKPLNRFAPPPVQA